MIKLAILASGSGSNAEAIINHFKSHEEISVELILANRRDAYVLTRGDNHGITNRHFSREEFKNLDVLEILESHEIDMIILAGFLWLVPEAYIERFPILNIHPALLPKHGGKGLYGMKVHNAVKQAGDEISGMTIHEVNKHYDEGHILFQESCPVYPEDTPEDIAARVLKLEHKNYPRVIEEFAVKTFKK